MRCIGIVLPSWFTREKVKELHNFETKLHPKKSKPPPEIFDFLNVQSNVAKTKYCTIAAIDVCDETWVMQNI